MKLQVSVIAGLLLFVIFTAPSTAQEHDLLGVFFDEEASQTAITTTEPFQPVPFYLILLDPSHSEGINAWECILEARTEGQIYLVEWQLFGEAFNVDVPPQFQVLLTTPLPQTAAVVLMSATVLVPEPDTEVLFYLHPYDPPSLTNPPGGYGYLVTTPLYGYGEDNYQSLGWTSGCEAEPVARINNDGEDPVWSLGNLPEEVLFGYVPVGETEIRYVDLENTGDIVLSGRLYINGDGFMYRHSGEYWTDEPQWFRIEPDNQLSVQLRVESVMEEEHTGALDITVCGETSTITLVKQAFFYACTVDPLVLDFGEVDLYSPDPSTSQVTITNTGTGDLWLSVTEDCPDFSAEFPSLPDGHLLPGQSSDLWVTFQPSSLGPQTCVISLGEDVCDDVVCTGIAIEGPPRCSVTPESWDFGEVAFSERTFEVRNIGGPLLEGQVTIPATCSAFGLANGAEPFSLAHDEIHEFTIGFKPGEQGPYTCSVFVSADCDSVQLSGTAAAYAESCRVEPEVVDFGTILTGDWAQRDLVISNHGTVSLTGDLQLIGHGLTLEGFTLEDAGPFTVAPGDPQTFSVSSEPPGVGRFDALVTTGLPGCSMVRLTALGIDYSWGCWYYENGDAYVIGSVYTPGNAAGVAVAGNYAYVTDYGSGLQVIDISDPESPVIVGAVDTPHPAVDVAVAGNYSYVAAKESGLQVIDITNPENPQIVSSVDTPSLALGVAVAGNYAFVADGSSGLQVIDISDPESPVIVGAVDIPWAFGVAVAGNYAYVANSWYGLMVIDISVPETPTIVGSVDTPDWAYGVAVAGNYSYVTDGNRHESHLNVIDISVPDSPAIVGAVDMCPYSGGVTVAGNYAYVANSWYGLMVIDISVPETPTIVGSVDTDPGGGAADVAVAGSFAYLAGYYGLNIAWRQCDEQDPVFLSYYSTHYLNNAVKVVWTVNGHGTLGEFRLVGQRRNWEWEVPYRSNGDGSFSATDATGQAAPGESVSYFLYYRDRGEDWVLLGRETIEREISSLQTRLIGNQPNPFNPQTTVSFSLPREEEVEIGVYDLTGRRVAVLASSTYPAGIHALTWTGRDSQGRAMPSGTYIVRLRTESQVEARKVMLVR